MLNYATREACWVTVTHQAHSPITCTGESCGLSLDLNMSPHISFSCRLHQTSFISMQGAFTSASCSSSPSLCFISILPLSQSFLFRCLSLLLKVIIVQSKSLFLPLSLSRSRYLWPSYRLPLPFLLVSLCNLATDRLFNQQTDSMMMKL